MRLFSAFFGVSTLLVLFLAVRYAFPSRRYLHLSAPVLLAATPSFALASGRAGPETSLALLSALLMWALFWTVRRGVTVFSLGGGAALVMLGWQVDWGFWWLIWPALVALPAALWRHRNDETHVMAQATVLVGVGIALAGGIIVLQANGYLLPWLTRLVRSVEAIVAHSVWPTAGGLAALFRRYWADFTDPGALWWASIGLWTLLGSVGLVVALWQERRAELIVPTATATALWAGALLVPGSVASWPAPAWPAVTLMLAAGWPHLVPRRVRPLWVFVGLLVAELLNLAALVG